MGFPALSLSRRAAAASFNTGDCATNLHNGCFELRIGARVWGSISSATISISVGWIPQSAAGEEEEKKPGIIDDEEARR